MRGEKDLELTPGASKQHKLDCTVVLWQEEGPDVPHVVAAARFTSPRPLRDKASAGLRSTTTASERVTREKITMEGRTSIAMKEVSR